MAILERDGVHLYYEVHGSGPTILFTHGFGASSHMFAANAEALSRDHTVVTWDMRGHGKSDYPTDISGYSAQHVVGDIIALLDVVGARTATVAGHSLGGYVSLLLRLTHPERVGALVLIDTGPGYRKPEPRDEWNAMAERYALSLEARGLGGLPGSPELTANVHRDASGLILAARYVLTQEDSAVIDSLPHITTPTLVIVGERDEAFLNGSRYMADKIPNALLTVIPGGDHSPNLSCPQEFDTVLRSFLESIGR